MKRIGFVGLGLAAGAMVVAAGLNIGLSVALRRDPLPPEAMRFAPGQDPRLKTMALFEYPSASLQGDAMVVFYSGDNGWAKADRGFADALSRTGVPVVGVDALRYFLTARSADSAAADLTAIIDHYGPVWRRSRVVLAGYSYGANALPLIAARLPARVRARVSLIALVGPGHQGRLVFRPYHWLDVNWPGSTALGPALAGAAGMPAICIYGGADPSAASACSSVASKAEAVRVPGGHRYKGVYVEVAKAIATAANLPTGTVVSVASRTLARRD